MNTPLITCKGFKIFCEDDYSVGMSFNPYVEAPLVDMDLLFVDVPQADFYYPAWQEKLTGYFVCDELMRFYGPKNYNGKTIIPERKFETVTFKKAGKVPYDLRFFNFGYLVKEDDVPKCHGYMVRSRTCDYSIEWKCLECTKRFFTTKPRRLEPFNVQRREV